MSCLQYRYLEFIQAACLFGKSIVPPINAAFGLKKGLHQRAALGCQHSLHITEFVIVVLGIEQVILADDGTGSGLSRPEHQQNDTGVA